MHPSRSELSRAQHARKWSLRLAAVPFAVAFISVAPVWPSEGIGEETIEGAGLLFIALAILGRTWCTLYIGGRKKRDLVTTGPYSLSRNPLYVFSILGALGIGMTVGSAVMGVLLATATFAILDAVTRREELYLAEQFNGTYGTYAAATPRWLPLHPSWRDAEQLEVKPRLVLTTFRDTCVMLLAIPAVEAIEMLHELAYLPVVMYLP